MTSVSSTASLISASTSSSTSTSSTSSSTSTSDIDWDGLIEEAVQAKLDKADSIDLKVTENEAKSAAYTSLQTLLAALETAAQALRAPSGSSVKSVDAFEARTAYLTANGDVDAASSVSATVESGSTTGTYDLVIEQLAAAHKVASATVASGQPDSKPVSLTRTVAPAIQRRVASIGSILLASRASSPRSMRATTSSMAAT
eukprot:gene46641-62387_t